MNYENANTAKTVRLDSGDSEWDGGTQYVCKYIEPVGFTATFCARGLGGNASHGVASTYVANDGNCKESPATTGYYDKVYLSGATTEAVILHLVQA